ncbi:hypothetical protein NBRC110019_15220 [Neptunitalea chrysea]|uniref:DUF4878 domain-containing protein n=1 Tax=Neptunitalea chrysea TaxID=1647581 RepID=A0A9W6B728_9FLAO|nr:hypothetical protein [Neptunitalea chrysea]GLB52482.1 hypothetical protein NBRC110019_15220 [Neptunitalea chrysea]
MSIKKYVFAFLFVAISFTGNAQEYKKEIKTGFSEYLTALTNKDFRKATDYMMPEIFTLVPKEQLIALMEQMLNNPTITIEQKNPQIKDVGDAKEIEGKYYSHVTYSVTIRIKFNAQGEETPEEKANRIEMMKTNLSTAMGAENITYDEETEFFEVFAERDGYAVSADGKTNWKFIAIEKGQEAILAQILPAELLN